jgi:hypothetical protein
MAHGHAGSHLSSNALSLHTGLLQFILNISFVSQEILLDVGGITISRLHLQQYFEHEQKEEQEEAVMSLKSLAHSA